MSALPRSAAPLTTLWASEAMRDFRCLGAACEATCCFDWQVPVDRPHYLALKKAMDGGRADREAFRAAHLRVRDGATDDRYALTVIREGRCGLLDGEGLCRTHKRFGEALLGDVCASYPRFLIDLGGRREATLRLSCPEVARRALLADEPATPWLAPEGWLGRTPVGYRLDASATFYTRVLLDVRDAALGLLSLERFPLSTRMFLLAYLAQRTLPFLRAGIERDPAEPLAVEITRVERPEVQDELARQLAELPVAPTLAEVVVLCMLEARLTQVDPAFRDLVGRSLAAFVPAPVAGSAPAASDGAQVMAAYREARDALPPALAARIDHHLARFARLQWLIRPYPVAPDLLVYVQDLAMRLAVVRLLLVGHPQTRRAATANDGGEEQRALVDQAAVEVIFRFSRAVDHGGAFLAGLSGRLAGEGLVGFPQTVALTRF